MTQITIHDAFAKAKILKKRIPQKAKELKFVMYKRTQNKKVNGIDVKDAENEIKSQYQSLKDDVKLLEEIYSKVSQSNATTKIVVNKKEYTITEALSIKNMINDYKKEILVYMTNCYDHNIDMINRKNEDLDIKADTYITNVYGSSDSKEKDIREERNKYIEDNTFVLVDPLNITQKMNNLKNELDNFESEIDSALSVSNSTTFIEVDVKEE